MPKVYKAPESDTKPEREEKTTTHKTVGVYDRPERTGPSREVLIAVAVIIALLLIFLFYKMARGADGVSAGPSAGITIHGDYGSTRHVAGFPSLR